MGKVFSLADGSAQFPMQKIPEKGDRGFQLITFNYRGLSVRIYTLIHPFPLLYLCHYS